MTAFRTEDYKRRSGYFGRTLYWERDVEGGTYDDLGVPLLSLDMVVELSRANCLLASLVEGVVLVVIYHMRWCCDLVAISHAPGLTSVAICFRRLKATGCSRESQSKYDIHTEVLAWGGWHTGVDVVGADIVKVGCFLF